MLDMTPEDFRAWRGRMAPLRGGKYSQADAARDLGMTVDMIKRYERPITRNGSPVPRYIALACAALEARLGQQ